MPHLSGSAERQTQTHGQNDTRPAQALEHSDGYVAGGGEGAGIAANNGKNYTPYS